MQQYFWSTVPSCAHVFSIRYNWQVDIFAVGCIAAELFLSRPLFPGTNEIDQLNRLCSLLGTPSDWEEGQKSAAQINYAFPQYIQTPLSEIIQNASHDAIDFIKNLLNWDPAKRPTADQCLSHPFMSNSIPRFQNFNTVTRTLENNSVETKPKTKPIQGIKIGAISKPSNVGSGRHKLN